ncbi:MAG: N-acetylmuramoyl-L-alanine amidase [Gemmatimonadales bacterium]|nr:N-acetylmuramoyl-L-alanine amidase [Gemmatimonadales bacterium]
MTLGALVWLAATGLAVAPSGPAAPMALIVATARGEAKISVRSDPAAGPVVAANSLIAWLDGKVRVSGAWAEVEVGRQPFRLLIGAPYYTVGPVVKPLVGTAVVRRDTLFLPIHFVTHVLPAELKTRYRYTAGAARLEDLATPPAVAQRSAPVRGSSPPVPTPSSTPATAAVSAGGDARYLPNGLLRGQVVAIDPGHGGVDPGNPGLFFPRGLKEKDVVLQVGLLLREELQKRGVGVIMTRTTDTLIDLRHRGAYCSDRCNLFVSLHVNSLPRRPGYQNARGFETFYLADAKTEDAARVARMENEAVRFETSSDGPSIGGLDFILKDLQLNEHLRESARLAELMQSHLAEVHDGPNRGVKQAGLMVLTTARRPAVLVELGFSTNREDARLMTTRVGQRNLAQSIADAVVAYLLEYQRRVGSVAVGSSGARE